MAQVEEPVTMKGEWLITVRQGDGPDAPILRQELLENIVLRAARVDVLEAWGGLSAMAAYIYFGVGSSATAEVVTQTALQAELEGNASRITSTGASGGAIVVTQETSGSYDQKLILEAIFPTGDGNNGSTFREASLYTTSSFATDIAGNRITFADIAKTASISVTFQVTLRM